MIEVALALAAGALVAAGFWVITSSLFTSEALMRSNYRGAALPTAVGVLIPLTVLVLVAAGHLALLSSNRPALWYTFGRTTVLAATAFSLLGLLDDIAGVGQSGGFRSHTRSIVSGNLSTGAVKVVGGAAAGVLVAARVPVSDPDVLSALRDGAVIALAANLSNLLDRAPGRTVKFSAFAFAGAVAVAGWSQLAEISSLAAPAVVVGASIGLLWPDLREKMMIGDAGANPLGALVGMSWLVAMPTSDARWILLAFLVLANAASELVSYSAVIDRVGPLRWFDRLGSLRG